MLDDSPSFGFRLEDPVISIQTRFSRSTPGRMGEQLLPILRGFHLGVEDMLVQCLQTARMLHGEIIIAGARAIASDPRRSQRSVIPAFLYEAEPWKVGQG